MVGCDRRCGRLDGGFPTLTIQERRSRFHSLNAATLPTFGLASPGTHTIWPVAIVVSRETAEASDYTSAHLEHYRESERERSVASRSVRRHGGWCSGRCHVDVSTSRFT